MRLSAAGFIMLSSGCRAFRSARGGLSIVSKRARPTLTALRGGSSSATLESLREELRLQEVDAMVIPSDDPHLSEYVAPCFERRAFVSGFTGSAGTVVVTRDRALCFTDGRYWLQAGLELGEGWTLVKAGSPGVGGVAEWFASEEGAKSVGPGAVVGIDAEVTSASFAASLRENAAASGASVKVLEGGNPVDRVWGAARPPAPANPVRVHPLDFAGAAVEEKLAAVRAATEAAGADALAVTALDEVCWLLNVRGSDVECNPVALGYALVTNDACTFFVDEAKVDADASRHLAACGVRVAPYADALAAIAACAATRRVLVDPARCSEAVVAAVPEAARVEAPSPAARLKAVKNAQELACMRAVHVRDGAYACAAFCEIEDRVRAGEALNECDVDAILLRHRSKDARFLEASFPTIAGSGPNGAVIHYRAAEATCAAVTADDMLLVDSGAQYLDGTTDATRTMHFGTPTPEEKRAYTAVLKGHIGLDTAVFPDETVGFVLDAFARKPLWQMGMDYGHGTGHGVGAALNVHEGPISISPRFSNTEPLKAGMVRAAASLSFLFFLAFPPEVVSAGRQQRARPVRRGQVWRPHREPPRRRARRRRVAGREAVPQVRPPHDDPHRRELHRRLPPRTRGGRVARRVPRRGPRQPRAPPRGPRPRLDAREDGAPRHLSGHRGCSRIKGTCVHLRRGGGVAEDTSASPSAHARRSPRRRRPAARGTDISRRRDMLNLA